MQPMPGTCQNEVNYHWFSCDSWLPKRARHVWGRSGKCLRLIASVSFARLTPSLCSLFFRTLSQFRSPRISFWKRLLRGLRFTCTTVVEIQIYNQKTKCNASINSSGDHTHPPPRATAGNLLTLSVPGMGHSQFYRSPGTMH